MKRKTFPLLLAAALLAVPVLPLATPDTALAAATRLATPSNVMIQGDRTVTWTQSPNASGYMIQVFDAATNKVIGDVRTSFDASSASIDSVLANKNGTYYVKVTATSANTAIHINSLASAKSNVLTISYSVTLTAPAAPVLATDGTVTWKNVPNEGYSLHVYHSPSQTLVTSYDLAKDVTTYDVKRLIPAAGSYYVRLIARGDGQTIRDSVESSSSSIRSLKLATLAAPSTVTLDSSRTATWSAVTANQGYRIGVYRAESGAIVGFVQAEKDQTTADLSKLITRSGRYFIKVQTLGLNNAHSLDSLPSPTEQFWLEANLYAAADDEISATTESMDGIAITNVQLDEAAVLAGVTATNAYRLVLPLDVKSGGWRIKIGGEILDKLLARSAANAQVQVLSEAGSFTLPLSELSGMPSSRSASSLADTYAVIELRPTTALVPAGQQMSPVSLRVSLTDEQDRVLGELDRTSGYLALTVPLPSGSGQLASLTGFRLDAAGRMLAVPALFHSGDETATATFKYQGNGTFGVLKKESSFPDVEESHYAKQSIESLTTRLVINGFEDGTFRPHETVTRAQFAQMIVKALAVQANGFPQPQLPSNEPTTPPPSETPDPTAPDAGTETDNGSSDVVPAVPPVVPAVPPTAPTTPQIETMFDDVPQDAWFTEAVVAAFRSQLINGRGDGVFAPNDLITEQEMATMIVRALRYAGYDTSLTDSEQSSLLAGLPHSAELGDYALSPVALCVRDQILFGPTLDRFDPTHKADRGQAADMLYRMMRALEFAN